MGWICEEIFRPTVRITSIRPKPVFVNASKWDELARVVILSGTRLVESCRTCPHRLEREHLKTFSRPVDWNRCDGLSTLLGI